MGRLIVIRREVEVVEAAVVGIVAFVVGTVMIVIVGRVIVSDVGGAVLDDVGVDDELVDELEVDEDDEDEVDVELVEVDPDPVRVPMPAVTRLLRSTVTSGNWTMLVPGMVLDSCGAVEEGKTSVRVSPPGLIT